jgi:hypothetical protein
VRNGKYNADFAITMAKKMFPEGVADRTVAAIGKCRGEWASELMLILQI